MVILFIILAALITAGVVILIIRYVKDSVVKEHPQAVGKDENYDRDLKNLERSIGRAMNGCELRMARRQVVTFRKKYRHSINAVSVENDVCELNRHIENKKIGIGLHPSVLN